MSGIFRSILAASSGLGSISRALANSAHNVANQNTPGFKARRSDFSDVVSGSLTGGGSAYRGSTELLSQGSFETTGRGLDLGIAGSGYLVVKNPANGEQLYTRAGGLRIDAAGNLLDSNGYQVQGFAAGGNGGLTSLNLGNVGAAQSQTTNVELGLNLNAGSSITAPGNLPVAGVSSFADYQSEAAFSSSVTVLDSLGSEHQLQTYFYHTSSAPAEFEYRVTIDGADVGAAAGSPVELASGTLSFQGNGQRATPVALPDAVVSPAYSNGALSGSIKISFSPATQFASASAVQSVVQDGTGVGQVQSVGVSANGQVLAQLDNGSQVVLGTAALAKFANPEGLNRQGGTVYSASSTSGPAVIGTPESGSFGKVVGGSLESSNVDVAAEFVTQSLLRQSFKANATVIRMLDELLEEIVSL